jgi:hypothetical protein
MTFSNIIIKLLNMQPSKNSKKANPTGGSGSSQGGNSN